MNFHRSSVGVPFFHTNGLNRTLRFHLFPHGERRPRTRTECLFRTRSGGSCGPGAAIFPTRHGAPRGTPGRRPLEMKRRRTRLLLGEFSLCFFILYPLYPIPRPSFPMELVLAQVSPPDPSLRHLTAAFVGGKRPEPLPSRHPGPEVGGVGRGLPTVRF